jgi:RecJ-like exonuclease
MNDEYPHKCPRCGGEAYVGFSTIECKRCEMIKTARAMLQQIVEKEVQRLARGIVDQQKEIQRQLENAVHLDVQ